MNQYTLKVTVEQLQVIADVLADAPYRKVGGIFAEIQRQVAEQEQAAKAAEEASPAPAKKNTEK